MQRILNIKFYILAISRYEIIIIINKLLFILAHNEKPHYY